MDAISQAIAAVQNRTIAAEVKLNEPMKNHTSFRIGGPIRAMIFPRSSACLIDLLDILGEYGVIPFTLGNGSNILASDGKIDKIVINTTKLNNIKLTDSKASVAQGPVEIEADGGVVLSTLAVFACEQELSGLEFAHGIPGTLGGAVVMNAGAYDGEMKDVIYRTTAYNTKAGMYTVTGSEHEFSYRHSRFSDADDVLLSSVIHLRKGAKEVIKQKMERLKERRAQSQPLDLPSGGSTFKRPAQGYAAEYIEKAGLKGFTIGGAAVSSKHAGFIVNRLDATFEDTMAVIKQVQDVVLKHFDVKLELEVKVLK